jgi:hypothetical protein
MPSQQAVPAAQIKDTPASVLPSKLLGHWLMNVS